MTDEDVRDMLAERARAIRPSTDGLAKIEARLDGQSIAPRRHPSVPLLAAAAVTVLALVGVAVFVQQDEQTSVDSGGFTAAPTVPAGVWPWAGDTVVPGVQDDPVETARAYVESRVPGVVVTAASGFQQGDARSGEVVFTGELDSTVALRVGDDGWYVVTSISHLITIHEAGDGTRTARVEADGELEQQTNASYGGPGVGPIDERTRVDAGDEITGLAYGYDEPGVSRRRFVLHTDEGTVGLTEVLFRSSDADSTTDTTPPTAMPAELPPGVWPFPQDDLDGVLLDDPVETARAYVGARVGISDRTTVSEYQAGDSNSGEVVFGGDIQTTVFVRRLDGWWHVEGAASDLVTIHEDDDGDGTLTAVVEAKGWLQSHVTLSTGSSAPLVQAREFDAGEEISDGLAYDLNTDRVVKAVRFLLTFGPEGTKGLTEVAFRPPIAESTG